MRTDRSVAGGRVLTALETAVLEQNAVALGMTIDALMENAGRAVAEEAAKHLSVPPGRVAVVAGPGNNGGDGTCAAFYLQQWGYAPELWLVRPPSEIRTLAARRCFDGSNDSRRPTCEPPDPMTWRRFLSSSMRCSAPVESGDLRTPYHEAVAAIRQSRAPVLSIDVPTGVEDPNGLRPRWTVALTALKEGMSDSDSGRDRRAGHWDPAGGRHRAGPGEFLFFPRPARATAQIRSTRIVVIGGGPYTGAPALAALAALRSGAERATVIAPRPRRTAFSRSPRIW